MRSRLRYALRLLTRHVRLFDAALLRFASLRLLASTLVLLASVPTSRSFLCLTAPITHGKGLSLAPTTGRWMVMSGLGVIVGCVRQRHEQRVSPCGSPRGGRTVT